jgi:hypothetical protein
MPDTNDKIASIRHMQGIESKLAEELSETRRIIQKELIELVEIRWGVCVGSTVSCNGKKYIVASFDRFLLTGILRDPPSKPWIKGHPMKADGTPSKALNSVGNNWSVEP